VAGGITLIQRSALTTLPRVLQRISVARHAGHGRAHSNTDSRLVHHVEHRGQTGTALTYQFGKAVALLAKLQEGVDDASLAQLMVQPGEPDIVAPTDAAIVEHVIARHHEQAESTHTRRVAYHTSQHQMDDVLAHLVLATGYPHLAAFDAIAAVRLWRGTRGDIAK